MDKIVKKFNFLNVIFAMLILFSVGEIGCQQKTENKNKPLKSGVIFPLTGDAASYGEKGQKAIDMAVEEINRKGKVNGREVAAVYEDSRAEPKTGVSAIQKLISSGDIQAVVGDIVSSVTLSIAPIVEKNKILLLSPTSSAPAITNAGEYVYRIWPSDLAEGSAIANYATKAGYKKAAILHLNNDYGLAIAKIFADTYKKGGGKISLMEGYLDSSNDFRTVISKIKQTEPDVIYVAGYYTDTSKIVKQARELGVNAQFLGTTAIEDNKFLELSGNAAEGIIYPLATGFDPASKDQVVRDFISNFQEKYNYQPGWVEAQSYDAFMLICDAVAHIKNEISGTAMKEYFNQMDEYVGVTGKIKFDPNGDVLKSISFKTVRNGKFQPL